MKTFIIEYQNLEGRFDVESVLKLLFGKKETLQFSKFTSKKLSEIADLRRGPFGGSIKKNIFVEDGPNTFQVYEQYNAINDDPKRARYFITPKDYARLQSFAVEAGDLIMSCSGTIGKITTIPENYREGVINQALLRIRLNDDDVIRDYFRIIFSYIIDKLLKGNELAYGSAIKNIASIKTLSEIDVPIPSKETQQKIVDIMQSAYQKKQELEQGADKLQTELDNLVFNFIELNIKDTETKITYIADSADLSNRIDSEYYQPKYVNLIDRLQKHKAVSFQDIIVSITNGIDYRGFSEDGIRYLRVGNIGKGKLKLNDVKYVPSSTLSTKASAIAQKGNLLLTRKGTYGIAYSFDREEEMMVSSEVFNIVLGEGINSKYVEIVLNSPVCQLQFERNKVGAIMGSLSQGVVKDTLIPVLSESEQNEIVDLYTRKQTRIDETKNEAKEVIEQAKAQVEEIILGK